MGEEMRIGLRQIEGEKTERPMVHLRGEGEMMKGVEEEEMKKGGRTEVGGLMIRMMIEEVCKEEGMIEILIEEMIGDKRRKGKMIREQEDVTGIGRRVTEEGGEEGVVVE